MSINASWFRMFHEMRRRHAFQLQETLCLGVQDVMFTHRQAENLCADRKGPFVSLPQEERNYSLSRNQQQLTLDPAHYMTVHDLFRMIGGRITTLDAFAQPGLDIQWDLCAPVPSSMHEKYDLLFDIGCLEHTADIFQALENVGNCVKVGGWLILYLPMVSPINTCMYHPNPPFYFDILAGNGFHHFDAWINWMPDWDPLNDIKTVWLNFKYNDDVFVWKERYYTVMKFIAQKREHVGTFRPVLQNYYQEWFSGKELLARESEKEIPKQPGAKPFLQRVLGYFRQEEGPCAFSFPATAASGVTPAQRQRFPQTIGSLPYSEKIFVPEVGPTRLDIPEQMAVGSPAREVLYL